jgi:hypothetical protein
MSVLHIGDIRKLYNEGHYTYKDLANRDVRRLPEDYVFDENLSVKRNREMVKAHNDEVEHLKRIKLDRQSDLDRKLTEDVVAYIVEYYDLTEAQARLTEQWVYCEKHSFMGDYFASIDTFAEFADTLVNLDKK